MPLGAFLDRHPVENFVGAELFQARGQDIARNAEAALEFLETPRTEETPRE